MQVSKRTHVNGWRAISKSRGFTGTGPKISYARNHFVGNSKMKVKHAEKKSFKMNVEWNKLKNKVN